jgi:hypothetical protein
MNILEPNTTLFFATFLDTAIYATGPQGDIPGGPIAFISREMAQEVVAAVGGIVVERTLEHAIKSCLEKGFTLWFKSPDGKAGYLPLTVPDKPGHLVRVDDQERDSLIEVAERQRRKK